MNGNTIEELTASLDEKRILLSQIKIEEKQCRQDIFNIGFERAKLERNSLSIEDISKLLLELIRSDDNEYSLGDIAKDKIGDGIRKNLKTSFPRLNRKDIRDALNYMVSNKMLYNLKLSSVGAIGKPKHILRIA